MEVAEPLLDRIFWAGLAENPHVGSVYAKEGLIRRGSWERKPAFHAFRDLIRSRR